MKKRFLIIALMSLFSTVQIQAQIGGGCCCTDCLCPPGPQGIPGISGPDGFQGIVGMPGLPGTEGPQGPCCNYGTTFANVFTELDQFSLAPGASPTFEGINVKTMGIDTSMAAVTGEITINIPGMYNFSWEMSGELTPPYPEPVPCITAALFLDGVQIPGSGNAVFLSSPNDVVGNLNQKVQLFIAAGQVVKLVNTTEAPIDLKANPFGTTIPIASASLCIRRFGS